MPDVLQDRGGQPVLGPAGRRTPRLAGGSPALGERRRRCARPTAVQRRVPHPADLDRVPVHDAAVAAVGADLLQLVGDPRSRPPGRASRASSASGPPSAAQLGSSAPGWWPGQVRVGVQGDVDAVASALSIRRSSSPAAAAVRLEVHRRVGQVQRAPGARGDRRPSRRTPPARRRRTSGGAGCSSRRARATTAHSATSSSVVGEHAGRVGQPAAHPDRALAAGPGAAARPSASSSAGRRGPVRRCPTTIIRSVPCGTRYAALHAMPWSSRSR